MDAKEYLDMLHRDLRDGNTARDREPFAVVALAFREVGLIDDETFRLRMLSLNSCPGHDDEGGRSWCAYCGNLSVIESTYLFPAQWREEEQE